MILSLIHNASLLLTLVLLHDVVVSTPRRTPSTGRLVFSGIILGSIGIVLAMTPLHLLPGIIYDTRSVLISVCGLFLGTIPTLLTMLGTALYRLFVVGGVGAPTGTLVIFVSGGIGLAWRRFRNDSLDTMTWRELFLFGVTVHIFMLLLMLTLPGGLGWTVLEVVALPVIIIYPTITTLLGALLVNRLCQKDARLALQASEERLRATLYSIGDAVVTTDCAGMILQMNPVAEELLGWKETEARGARLADVFRIIGEESRLPLENPVAVVLRSPAAHDAASDPSRCAPTHCTSDNKVVGADRDPPGPDPQDAGSGPAAPGWRGPAGPALLISRDGREIPVSSSAAPILDEQETTIGVVLVFRSQAVERALERERLMLTETIRSSLNEIYIFDATTLRFRFVNQGALNNLGYSTDQIREMTLLSMNPTFSRERFMSFAEPLFDGTTRQLVAETEFVRADGSRYPVEAHLQFIDYRGDRVFLSINQDLTTKRKAEEQARLATAEAANLQEQLFHAQKMESVGRLAGGVAHDFNNMLGVIIGHTDLAMAKLAPADPVIGNMREIRRAAEHSADLTKQLLAFARKQTIHPCPMDLNATVPQALKMLRRLIGESIQLLFTPEAGLWTVQMDPAQLDQILANLAVNARDAIAGAGTITIATSNVVLDEEFAASHPTARTGEFVLLSVTDTGCGMDPETLSHLFEPFFTTKRLGEGTGLGLATIYGIVSQNRGFILVSSHVGRGSEFRVYMPRCASKSDQKGEELAKSDLRGTETLLIVEDEPELLLLAKTVMSGCGYRVLTAGSPEEALRIVESDASRIDLLVTDVVMPAMNGRELSERIGAMRPDIRVLYISGYTADIIARQGIVPEDVMLLEKPFSPQEFAAKVRAVLDGPEKSHFL